jgi:peptidoglycan-associated lipoprotein
VKRVLFGIVLALFVVSSIAAMAQEYPKFETSISYSFVNVHPDIPQFTSFNVNGGGGSFVYNFSQWIGVKADFNGYTAGNSFTNQIQNLGYAGNVNGNVFTYLFGPQIKKHSGKLQPFGEALFGAAHSNAYATIFNAEGFQSGSSNNNAFAMEFGGGLDYVVNKHLQIRPAEVDYLYTRFGVNGTSYTGNQNNFKYAAGVNFTFGGNK